MPGSELTVRQKHLVLRYQSLAKNVSRSLWKAGKLYRIGTVEDVIQEAQIELIRAVLALPKGEQVGGKGLHLRLRKHLTHRLSRKARTEGIIRTPSYATERGRLEKYPEQYASACKAHRNIVNGFDLRALRAPESKEPDANLSSMYRLVELLPSLERTVITRLYGLGSGPPERVSDVGKDLGLTGQMVGKIKAKAIRLLRERVEQPYETSIAA